MAGDNSNTRRFKLKKSNTLKTLKIQGLRHKKSLKIKNLEMVGVVLDLLHAHRVSPKGLCPS